MTNLKHAIYFFAGFFLGFFISSTTIGAFYMLDEKEMRDE
jgi:hypothetical protein